MPIMHINNNYGDLYNNISALVDNSIMYIAISWLVCSWNALQSHNTPFPTCFGMYHKVR